jgi:hypothetical protein
LHSLDYVIIITFFEVVFCGKKCNGAKNKYEWVSGNSCPI